MSIEIKNNSEVMKPPIVNIGLIGWISKNLFSSWLNTALTLIAIYVLYLLIPPFISWTILDADFVGTTKQECSKDGACWIFIKENLKLIFYGLYPSEELSPVRQIILLKNELDSFKDDLTQKVSWIICNKIDLIQDDELDIIQKEIETELNFSSKDIFFISAATGEGTKELLKSLETEVLDNKSDLA